MSPRARAAGEKYIFTIEEGANGANGRISVNYDGFIDDVSVGDTLLVDGGIMSLKLLAIEGKDVTCQVVDGGVMKSRCARPARSPCARPKARAPPLVAAIVTERRPCPASWRPLLRGGCSAVGSGVDHAWPQRAVWWSPDERASARARAAGAT